MFSEEQTRTTTEEIVVGSCMTMCPVEEIRLRERENLLHPFEVAKGHRPQSPKADHEKMVKEYRRPTVGKDTTDPSDLRPASVLQRTVNYLMDRIATSDYEWYEIYDFVFDRLRSVRRDLVIQQIDGAAAVDILEKCVRFLVFSDYRLCMEKMAVFDQKINSQHTQECLKRLLNLYQRSHPHGPCENQAEFQSIYLLFNLGETDAISHYYSLDKTLRDDPAVKLAHEASVSYVLGNWVRVFRLLRTLTSPIQLCAVHRHFPFIQSYALRVMSAGYSSKVLKFPLTKVTNLLAFNTDSETAAVCQSLGISISGASVQFSRASFRSSEVVARKHSDFISESLQCCDIRDILPGENMDDMCKTFTSSCNT